MAKKTPPSKKQYVQMALSAAAAAGVSDSEIASCPDLLDAIADYNMFGFGGKNPTYTQAEFVNVKSGQDEDINLENGKSAAGADVSLKQVVAATGLSVGSAAGLSSYGKHYYFPGVSGSAYSAVEQIAGTSVIAVTASSGSVDGAWPIYVYSQNGPQSRYVPSVQAASGAFNCLFIPAILTASMPLHFTSSLIVEVAGATAHGEGVGLYYQTNQNGPSAWYTVANESGANPVFNGLGNGTKDFLFSASWGSWATTGVANYSHSGPIQILTSSMKQRVGDTTGGLVLVYSASWSDGLTSGDCTTDNESHAGIVAKIYPA